MELAVHLREPAQLEAFEGVGGHLNALYGRASSEKAVQGARFPGAFRRFYVGDEFCLHRLVDPEGLDEFVRLATDRGLAITLLTPPVTDRGLERCASLFARLDEPRFEAEVVVNDWGALQYLRDRHPSLSVSVGRLLNKGFKDPRLRDTAAFSNVSPEAAELLNRCTFDSARFREEMPRRRVSRLERDLLPHATPRWEETDRLGTSVYFPFGYVTMGRVCWLASVLRRAGEKFSLRDTCSRTCRDLSLRLSGADTGLQLFQEGNAILYLYPAPLLTSFLAWAGDRGLRCVYQGLAMGVP